MVGKDWENSLNGPNSSKRLPYVPKCPEWSLNVPKCPQCPLQKHRCPNGLVTSDDGSSDAPEFPNKTQERREETVKELLLSRDPNEAAGPDEIESRFLKECAKELAPVLRELFHRSFEAGEVPGRWKEANIVPIPKSGSKSKMSNFRPVALTSMISKVCEKIVCSVIMAFLGRNNLTSQQQHRFVSGRSCQTNILLCLEK